MVGIIVLEHKDSNLVEHFLRCEVQTTIEFHNLNYPNFIKITRNLIKKHDKLISTLIMGDLFSEATLRHYYLY